MLNEKINTGQSQLQTPIDTQLHDRVENLEQQFSKLSDTDVFNAEQFNYLQDILFHHQHRGYDRSQKLQPAPGTTTFLYANTSVPSGNTVANTTTETAFSSSYTFPANSLKVGDIINLRLWGVYGTTGVAPTLTGKVKLAGVTLLNTGALTCIINLTNSGWSANADFIVTAAGTNGTIEAQGYAEFSTAATTSLSVNVVNTTVVSVNTAADAAFTVTVTWGTANAANTITLREMIVTKASV